MSQAQEVWMKKFIEMDIPEPETSIKLILSKILGLKNVNYAHLDLYFQPLHLEYKT